MSSSSVMLRSLLLFSFIVLLSSQAAEDFTCTGSTKSCEAMAGYVTANATTYTAIKDLFEIKSIRQLFGSNNLPVNTSGSSPVAAGATVRIPFPCLCFNNSGLSSKRPEYTVKKGDFLDHIARDIFAGLVTSQQIADANNISDPSKIFVGQKLWIPLPCSCDQVDGQDVVHYAHKVASGSSVAAIAGEFGTSAATLMKLNGIADPKALKADQILDVPLKACSSSIRNDSADSGILAANGTYFLTANNCVQCSCSSTSSQLQCMPTQRVLNSTCPNVRCDENNLTLGGTLPTSSCDVPTCVYAGYKGEKIFTVVANVSTCAAPGGGGALAPSSSPSPSNSPATSWVVGRKGSGWMELFVLFNVVSFSFGLL